VRVSFSDTHVHIHITYVSRVCARHVVPPLHVTPLHAWAEELVCGGEAVSAISLCRLNGLSDRQRLSVRRGTTW